MTGARSILTCKHKTHSPLTGGWSLVPVVCLLLTLMSRLWYFRSHFYDGFCKYLDLFLINCVTILYSICRISLIYVVVPTWNIQARIRTQCPFSNKPPCLYLTTHTSFSLTNVRFQFRSAMLLLISHTPTYAFTAVVEMDSSRWQSQVTQIFIKSFRNEEE